MFTAKRCLSMLESQVKEYFGLRYVWFVSSGKAALYLILLALKSLSSRRRVVIPAYTCFSVPSAIVKAGLEVALCDIDPETFDFEPDLLEQTIDTDTLCVIPNHLFGIPSDMDRIIHLCEDRRVFVVEDAAQAMGGGYDDRLLGTMGDAGFFSLGRGKNITCGSGGIVGTNSGQIADAIAPQYAALEPPTAIDTLSEFLQVVLMTIFIRPSLYWLPAGLPFLRLGQTKFYKDFPIKSLSGMKAGLLRNWQQRLEHSNHARAAAAAYFGDRLRLIARSGTAFPYLRLPILLDSAAERDRIYTLSQKHRLGISLMYPTAINEVEEIKAGFNGLRLPAAPQIAERLLTIPTHPLLSENDKAAISRHLSTVNCDGKQILKGSQGLYRR
jgi:perosamine synthetase